MKRKWIKVVTQAKGGSGKSTLTFLLSEKYKNALILDLDDATKTTSKQLAYRKPPLVSFLEPISGRIDRSAFNTFFENVSLTDREIFIGDLGASVAEQLPKYFETTGPESIQEMLLPFDIQLQLVCIINGGNDFRATMEYLVTLCEAVNKCFEIIAAHNLLHPLSVEQQKSLDQFTSDNQIRCVSFDLINDKGELARRTAENVLQAGKGLSGLSPFTGVYFKKSFDNLDL